MNTLIFLSLFFPFYSHSLLLVSFFLAFSLFMRKSLLARCLKRSAKIRYFVRVNESSLGESVSSAFTQVPWIRHSILWQQSKQGSSNSVQKVNCCTNNAKVCHKYCIVLFCICNKIVYFLFCSCCLTAASWLFWYEAHSTEIDTQMHTFAFTFYKGKQSFLQTRHLMVSFRMTSQNLLLDHWPCRTLTFNSVIDLKKRNEHVTDRKQRQNICINKYKFKSISLISFKTILQRTLTF